MFIVSLIVGYIVGTLAFPNIVLPLLWSWPKARRLDREGKLTKPIPRVTLLLAPVVWFVLVGLSCVAVTTIAPSLLWGYVAGATLSLVQTLCGLLSGRERAAMESAFQRQWRDYLKASL